MPHFRQQLYHMNGVPVGPGGFIPLSIGKCSNGENVHYYWVDGTNGSDNNTGLSPNRAKATIAAAVTLANANISWTGRWSSLDVIVVAPGVYAENLTSLPYGGSIVGLGDSFDLNGINGVTIKPASGSPFDATSVINCRVHNLCFESPDTSPCFDVENFNRNWFTHCVFTGETGGTTTHAFRVKDETNADGNGDMTGSRLTDCIFQVAEIGFEVETDNGSSKQASGNIIEHGIFRGLTAKGLYFHADCVPSYTMVNHCIVGDGSTTLALGLDDDTDQVGVNWCTFQATANDPATASGGKYNGCYLNGALLTQS